ncbi:MAG TPA: hypothetical protein VFF30_13585 [Nitrososphaerales archaeon]|nr:hypothetical protein [Nitrososphaerales archaeon]
MARRVRAPIRLDIVGLSPRLFDACVRSNQALVESRTKGAHEVSRASETIPQEFEGISSEVLVAHKKIASIAIDFRRAYGRSEVRVFEKSTNRFVERFFRSRKRSTDSAASPEFFVNGVRVFKGLPQSFSELDEAIDKAFGRSEY